MAKDWGGELHKMQPGMCAKLCTSPPGLKESPDGSPGQLGSGGGVKSRHHHPLLKPGLSGQEGAPAVLASWDLGCLGRGQAPSSDVGLEATKKLPEKLPPCGPLSLWMSHPPALGKRRPASDPRSSPGGREEQRPAWGLGLGLGGTQPWALSRQRFRQQRLRSAFTVLEREEVVGWSP